MLHEVNVRHVGRFPRAEEGDDDCEANGDFGSCDRDDEKDRDRGLQ